MGGGHYQFNLLPQLTPANNKVQQEIKNAKTLSEPSRIPQEADQV